MRWCLIPLLLLLLIGCDIPSASTEKNPTLVIATDQLMSEDSLFFAKFAQQNNIKIELRKVSVDSLIQLFKADPFGLGIDIVFVHQLYDMRRVRNTKMLEPLKLGSFPEEATMQGTESFIKIGIDPFVCISKQNVQINIYDDLHKQPFFMNLGHKSKTQFFAPYEERMHRSKTFERMTQLNDNSVPMRQRYVDSTQTILTSYANYRMKDPEDSIWNTFVDIQFPNSATSGVFNDVLTAGVIRQSAHYQLSSKLLNWMVEEKTNNEFVANRGYDPLRSNGNYRRFSSSPVILMQYHTMIERMLKQLP